MEVAQSMMKSKSSSVGMPMVSGFVPNMPSTPKVGATDGRALVPVMPMQPCLHAMVG